MLNLNKNIKINENGVLNTKFNSPYKYITITGTTQILIESNLYITGQLYYNFGQYAGNFISWATESGYVNLSDVNFSGFTAAYMIKNALYNNKNSYSDCSLNFYYSSGNLTFESLANGGNGTLSYRYYGLKKLKL
jgi:hypothetical protein